MLEHPTPTTLPTADPLHLAEQAHAISPSARDFLSGLLQARLLEDADAATPWKERVHESQDAFNYLSLTMVVPESGVTTIATIEFGVRDAEQRHAVGILLADWHHDEARLGPIQLVKVDGETVDITSFAARLRPLLDLPTAFRDSAEDVLVDE